MDSNSPDFAEKFALFAAVESVLIASLSSSIETGLNADGHRLSAPGIRHQDIAINRQKGTVIHVERGFWFRARARSWKTHSSKGPTLVKSEFVA